MSHTRSKGTVYVRLPSVGRPRVPMRIWDAITGHHSRKLNFAMQKCVEWHSTQKRKDGSPYSWHPFAVLANLKAAGITNKEVLIAGLLHDTVEDKHTTYAEVQRLFGKRVAMIVREVSKRDDGSFHLSTREGFQVKMADRFHNLSTLEGNNPAWIEEQIRKSEKLVSTYGPQMVLASPFLFDQLASKLHALRKRYPDPRDI